MALGLFLAFSAPAGTLYVNVSNTAPVAPYGGWSSAATNIQDAIDAAADGDLILVASGVYRTGGKVMAGDLTNRVALDKAVTVASVSGPFATVIEGAGQVNNDAAIRCAWLTNGATLSGFMLRLGATRTAGAGLQEGGGAWCASTNAFLLNCIIQSNTAWISGGGVHQGTIRNSYLTENRANISFSAANNSRLENCTVVSNFNTAVRGTLNNCIVYFNQIGNYASSTFTYSCTVPLPAGPGNTSAAPQLYSDNLHLLATSPCRGTGINPATGTDIFGQPWANPPSMGCAEWSFSPVVGPPAIQLKRDPVGFTIAPAAVLAEPPFSFQWLKDGTPLAADAHISGATASNLTAIGVVVADPGEYQVVVSNAFGVATSAVVRLVARYVDLSSAAPTPPYEGWSTAALTIQDAIDAALTNEIVFVTNGIYASGGRVMQGEVTNRVALNKPMLVQSVNGPLVSVIEGLWGPGATNGPLAIRCAALTNGAILSGFTLRGGGTRTGTGAVPDRENGGGVWGSSTNATVFNCIIATNTAGFYGGGAYRATLDRCIVAGNVANGDPSMGGGDGGGAFQCFLKSSVVVENRAAGDGGGIAQSIAWNSALARNIAKTSAGGAHSSTLVNCTVAGNSVNDTIARLGGGVADSVLTNCIVFGNRLQTTNSSNLATTNHHNSTFAFSCTGPLPAGAGNFNLNPQLLPDGTHVAETSPCRAAGTAGVITGVDIDGQPWVDLPSIGCDEWYAKPVVTDFPTLQLNVQNRSLTFAVVAGGETPLAYQWFKDGAAIVPDGRYDMSVPGALTVSGFDDVDAGYYEVAASNGSGAVTSRVAQVVIRCVSAANSNPVPPYQNWAAAATNIQDAVDAAAFGDIVLITNGVYSSGGRLSADGLSNRVVIEKSITVLGFNSASAAIIEGAKDPLTTNGPLAMRCVRLGNGALLGRLTLRGGATLTNSGPAGQGGGVWAATNTLVTHCVIQDNSAESSGGGAYGGRLSNCLLTNNSSRFTGGGVASVTVTNSFITRNLAATGSGAYGSTLHHCTVTGNGWIGPGGSRALDNCTARNSIVMFNGPSLSDNFVFSQFSYSCSEQPPGNPPPGAGNIAANPRFLERPHIAVNSPCRGNGSPLFSAGTDIDGEPYAGPPSMGCDEVVISGLTGPLTVGLLSSPTNLPVHHFAGFTGLITGRATHVDWSFDDGPAVTNAGASIIHSWTNTGVYNVIFTVYNLDHPDGVSTNIMMNVMPLLAPVLASYGVTSNGFTFTFGTQSEATYRVQVATNLAPPVVWQTFTSIFLADGSTVQVVHPSPTNSQRFYRVKVE